MKKTIFIVLILALMVGCAPGPKVIMPQMDLPSEPIKPKIQSQVITQGDKAFVAYTIPDALKLYSFLIEKDAYDKMLIFRINQMNQLLQGK